MYCRLEVVDRAADNSFRLPLTQAQVGDALGLSAVHVNRVVSEMRNEGLIAWNGHRVRLRQWRELAGLAEFDGAYLELPPRSA
ncbi:transcriptional regulator FixK [compost metagenome]